MSEGGGEGAREEPLQGRTSDVEMGRTSSRSAKDSQPSLLAPQISSKRALLSQQSGVSVASSIETPLRSPGDGGKGGDTELEVEDESAGLLGRREDEPSDAGKEEAAQYRLGPPPYLS